jgi:hypothetical protein
MEQQEQQPLFKMEIDMISEDNIRTIAKWGRFVAVSGFVIMGLVLLLILIGGEKMLGELWQLMEGPADMKWLVITLVVLAVAVYGAWFFFMLQSSSLLNKALRTKSNTDLAAGFNAVRNFFILSIVISCTSIAGTLLNMI